MISTVEMKAGKEDGVNLLRVVMCTCKVLQLILVLFFAPANTAYHNRNAVFKIGSYFRYHFLYRNYLQYNISRSDQKSGEQLHVTRNPNHNPPIRRILRKKTRKSRLEKR